MKAFLLILSMGWCLQGISQQEYFVFLQTENRQPFYVRLGEKNYSSSANGYLILSKLQDSSYSFAVGFPQNQFPEQTFSVIINKKDRGFEIKNLGSQGWALFDLQTLQLINSNKPAGAGSGGAAYNLIKKEDDFARLMAGVVNDTAVMYTVVMEEKKQEPVVVSHPVKDTVATKDTVAVAIVPEPRKEDSVKHEEVIAKNEDTVVLKTDTVAQKIPEQDQMKDSVFNPPALPLIHIVHEFKSDSGYHITYVDDTKDSIEIFIPAEKDPVVTVHPKTDTAASIKTDTASIPIPPSKETIIDTAKTNSKLVMINSDCRSFASVNDVDKLRVKLLNEKDSEARIATAKKAFKSKCYSAQQIKALSEMFPYDEQKYKFFETAYPFVSDTGNFKSLVSLFTDPVYAQRFRKLVRID